MGRRVGYFGLTALPLMWANPALAAAQPGDPVSVAQPPGDAARPAAPATSTVDFSADQVSYDSSSEAITATGRVRIARDGYYLAADSVTYRRSSDQATADGNVVLLSPSGEKLIGDHVLLTNALKDATVDNLLVVLESGGRIAARRGERKNGKTTLYDAIYSACPVVDNHGCPKRPSWTIRAAKITQDPAARRIKFDHGRLGLFGLDLPLLPFFAVDDGTQKYGRSGFLIPDLAYSHSNGLEVSQPYHWQFASDNELTLTPHAYTLSHPALGVDYRRLTDHAAFHLGGFATYGALDLLSPSTTTTRGDGPDRLRAYGEASGKVQFDPRWSLSFSLRRATDKTLLRRYDISYDDKLRSTVNLERIDPNSYISIAGWAFQGLLATDKQGQIPIALPAIEARFRRHGPLGHDTLEIDANSLAIFRTEGQDSQRAFVSAQYDWHLLTPLGQLFTATAFARGDLYHTANSAATTVVSYRGLDGWHARAIGALAADLRWPFAGRFLGGTQTITPRIQLVLTPKTTNLSIPNEDARSVDLEDSNLFALNRFPGNDRWEAGPRVTYGVEYALVRPHWSIDSVIGQSYRLNSEPSLFPDGTGLTDQLSDVVGRTRVRFANLVNLTHRFRLDKDNLAVRRNELDLTLGGTQTYLELGYLKLNRHISPTVEDLRDREELRLAGRLKFHHYWSVFGSTVLDLTTQNEDPQSTARGFAPVRHRLGIEYEDDCLQLGVSWKRDYEVQGDFRKGSTFQIHFSLKGLGR